LVERLSIQGFTDEEFIIHYDIKYRMGKTSVDEEVD
jgi:hypothetical protein